MAQYELRMPNLPENARKSQKSTKKYLIPPAEDLVNFSFLFRVQGWHFRLLLLSTFFSLRPPSFPRFSSRCPSTQKIVPLPLRIEHTNLLLFPSPNQSQFPNLPQSDWLKKSQFLLWSQFESQFCPNFSQSRPFLKIGTPLDQSDCVSVPIFRNWEIGTDTHSDWLVSKSQQTWPTKRSSIFAVTAKLLTSINIALRMVFTERFKIKYQWYYFKDMLK